MQEAITKDPVFRSNKEIYAQLVDDVSRILVNDEIVINNLLLDSAFSVLMGARYHSS